MKRISLLICNIALFAALTTTLTSCPASKEVDPPTNSSYTINGDTFKGSSATNSTLKAIEVPCNNNNTLRLYYSDSVAIVGFPATMKIMSYQHAGNLHYGECYLEVSTSATDTWLTTGNGNVMVTSADQKTFTWTNAQVQHFTSVPTTEAGTLSGTLTIK